ncbi:uncharacterized protein EAE98_010155 [Botrytis deweyae]|uniref:HNH nuclease domain-containing protein n=1 Tax=Botrytis deweyae TaxID=2478750 RepID=A0ABQ7I9C1_9HELO|nr:uncharacterized protein EAE98_010155 [Botrytis deweyae]KAF7917392.1 hypothetical protein EAE98_010155 [Botrytis deweyae]
MSKLHLEISRLRDRAIQEIPRLRRLINDYEEFVANEDYISIDLDCNAVVELRKLLRIESKGVDENSVVESSNPANSHVASSSALIEPLSPPALEAEPTSQPGRVTSGAFDGFENEEPNDPKYPVPGSIERPLIIQAFRCTEENPSAYYTVVSEDTIFSTIPMLRVLFEGKIGGGVKDDDDDICHDPERSTKLKIKVPGKIVSIHNVITSEFHDANMNYGTIAQWPVHKLWLYSSCLVDFWDKKKLRSAISTAADLENIRVLADFLLVSKSDREIMHKQLSSYIKKRKYLPAAGCGQTSNNNQQTVSAKRESSYEGDTNNKKARYEIIDLTGDDNLRKQKPRAGYVYARERVSRKHEDPYVPGGNAVLHNPDREEPSDWRGDTATGPSRRGTDDHMDKCILIQSLTASGEYEHCLEKVMWVTEESSLLSSLIKGCTATSEPALEGMVNLDDWHEGGVCISVDWNFVIRHYAVKNNQEAVMIQGWGVEMAFKALGPWLERVGKSSEYWVEWEPEVLEKACVVEKFIGATDRRCNTQSLV